MLNTVLSSVAKYTFHLVLVIPFQLVFHNSNHYFNTLSKSR